MSAAHHDLIVSADSTRAIATLRLLDATGRHLSREVNISRLPISRQQILFDLRSYLRLYGESGHERDEVARAGVFLAEEILGRDIFLKLWWPRSQRFLRVQLPEVDEENPLGAWLTRIPWEIARPSPSRETLAERNLVVRVVYDMEEPPTRPIVVDPNGCLRILLIFAEANLSQPLSMRRERREILRMFQREVYPHRRIAVDVLAHGVTRDRLRERIRDRGGYHVVHWSGHGHLNRLDLADARGMTDRLTGQELVDLFVEAGGFLPQLVVLSACQSGGVEIRDWKSFLVAAGDDEPGTRGSAAPHPKRDIEIEERPGYTGTAHALLQSGVPSVIAMRYAVGDEYARSLALELYRALFADTRPKSAATALTMARKALLAREPAARFDAADHATAVLYGAEDPGLRWGEGRSPALDTRDRRIQRIPELTLADHPGFIGRTREMAQLGARFIGTARDADARPLALVTGLGGMGKTALAAEAYDVWNQRFDWVLPFQAKQGPLDFETTLRHIHLGLRSRQGRYFQRVQRYPAEAVYLDPGSDTGGMARSQCLCENLVRALRDEAILLILDNFEANLRPVPEPCDGRAEPLWACRDPDWSHCLACLATELSGTPSRVLITCRHQLAALADAAAAAGCLRVRLSPLPAGEAALFLREHPGLRRMVFGADPGERELAERLLQASRFHPLLMEQLARLATGGPDLRPRLLAALDAICSQHDATQLPQLFAARGSDAAELAYLEDALSTSIDELIRNASADTRRLLWILALANEPVSVDLLRGIWGGESDFDERLRWTKRALEWLPALSEGLRAELDAAPPELRAWIAAAPSGAPVRPDPAPLLAHLVAAGLVAEETARPGEGSSGLTCHELVREHIRRWMEGREEDRGGLTERAIRLAYAERFQAAFRERLHEDLASALEAGRRALVYCVQAEAWDLLGTFANRFLTSTKDPAFLETSIPYLAVALGAAPEGRARWSALAHFADALRNAGRPDASLEHYERAVERAYAGAEAPGAESLRAWADLGALLGNWGEALAHVGDLDAARQRYAESAVASLRAGRPEIEILANEVSALGLDIFEGKAADALPRLEAVLGRLEAWWRRHLSGRTVPEAPDPEFLARLLVGGLDTAHRAHLALGDPEAALRALETTAEIEGAIHRAPQDLGATRFNRAVALGRLGRFDEARRELEACLDLFRSDPAKAAKALGALAELFDAQGDTAQALALARRVLATCDQLPDPRDRAGSHTNLANYLARTGAPERLAEATRHRVAALAYLLASGLQQGLGACLRNHAIDVRRARAAGKGLAVPGLSTLVGDPAFRLLAEWLERRGEDVAELGDRIDRHLAQARDELPAAG